MLYCATWDALKNKDKRRDKIRVGEKRNRRNYRFKMKCEHISYVKVRAMGGVGSGKEGKGKDKYTLRPETTKPYHEEGEFIALASKTWQVWRGIVENRMSKNKRWRKREKIINARR